MKNSTLLLPARLLCNMCVDHSRNDLYQCQNDQIPLESLKHASSLKGVESILSIQTVITNCLLLLIKDINENSDFYSNKNIGCI
jgi:hypothetical protein